MPIPRPASSLPRLGAALLLATLLAGCASAGKRLEQGQALEQQGRPADAARRYIDALKKDRTLAEARTRLQDAGDRAVSDWLAEAGQLGAGRPADAAETLMRLDDLVADASGVGVELRLPGDYGARRSLAFGRAVDYSLDQSRSALDAGDFSAAERWLARSERWQPSTGQREQLLRARYEVQMAWGDAELRAGRFRSAHAHAAAAAALPGDLGDAALRLQQEALERGTVRVAIFPVGTDPALRSRLPRGLLAELNDVLALQQWQRPPQWLEVIDPRMAAREARRRMYDQQAIPVSDAAYMGRSLGSRLAVVMEVDSVRETEQGVETQRRTARTRAGVDTAFTVRSGRVESWARVSWQVAEVEGWRGVVERGTASGRGDRRFRRASYAGDWRTLQLSSSDRELFERQGELENVRELAGELASELGRDIFAALLRRVD